MNKDIHNIHALYKSQSEAYLQGQGLVEDVVWDKGYTAFSLSHSQLEDIMHFFANQYTYHKKNSFAVEHRMLLKLYQIERSFMST
jgi:hypothetical protein